MSDQQRTTQGAQATQEMPKAPPGGPPPPKRSPWPWIVAAVAILVAVAAVAALVVTVVLPDDTDEEPIVVEGDAERSEDGEEDAAAGEDEDADGEDGDAEDGDGETDADDDEEPADGSGSAGPVTTPEYGGPVRAALMDAARVELDSEAIFYVLQLYRQGDTALGELQEVGGDPLEPVAVQFVKDAGGWRGVWHGPVNVYSRRHLIQESDLTLELIDAMDWREAPTVARVEDVLVANMASMTGWDESRFTPDVRGIAKGTDGAWYAWGWVAPDDPGYESEQWFLKRPAGTTEWETLDYGTGLDPSDVDLPANVEEQWAG